MLIGKLPSRHDCPDFAKAEPGHHERNAIVVPNRWDCFSTRGDSGVRFGTIAGKHRLSLGGVISQVVSIVRETPQLRAEHIVGCVMDKFTRYIQRKSELEAQIARDRDLVRDEVLIEILLAIEEFHFDTEDLFPADRRRKIKPKYFDPQSGAVWSGRGREPLWLRGKNRQDFELDTPETEREVERNRE
ncbi:H-NS histone family protein [Burkholderia sp. 9777_1386]|uniref:H-NS histone family protein n=1 Tax=Burkholderia sp. 9777_1386 TaxID=2751183 RepID=UPI001E5BEE04|nr:H-NS histone family protein [Burkholderia sp. 9777_1386]